MQFAFFPKMWFNIYIQTYIQEVKMNYIGHLAFGINALNILKQNNVFINKENFLTGCLAPDIARTDLLPKSVTHFRDNCPNLYKSPDLNKFLSKYGNRLDEDFILGYFCHLYADNVFTKIFLFETAMPLDENFNPTYLKEKSVYVKNIKTNDVYDISNKTKSTHLYTDYSKLTHIVGNYFDIPYEINYSTKDPLMEEIDPCKLMSMQDKCIKFYNKNTESLFSDNSQTHFMDADKYIKFIEEQSTNFVNDLSKFFYNSNSDFKSII